MKKKLVSLFISLLVVSSLCFPSVALAAPKETKKPQEFTAKLSLEQVVPVNNVQRGKSDRFRSIDEKFNGIVINSTWPAINGGIFEMQNFTNFEYIFVGPSGYGFDIYYVNGNIHGTAQIEAAEGNVLYLVTNGKIEGNIPTGAMIDMTWNSIGGTGIFAGTHANGTLEGSVDWFSAKASGVMELSGKYK